MSLLSNPPTVTISKEDDPTTITAKLEESIQRPATRVVIERLAAKDLDTSTFPEGAKWLVEGCPREQRLIVSKAEDPIFQMEAETITFGRQLNDGEQWTVGTVSLQLSPNDWWRSLDYEDYAAVLSRSIERRKQTHDDVSSAFMYGGTPGPATSREPLGQRFLGTNLVYLIGSKKTNVLAAAEEIEAKRLLLIEPAETLANRMAIAVQETISRLSKWRDAPLDRLVDAIDQQTTAAEKGEALEELAARLLDSVPGFLVERRIRTETEEIDLHLFNDSRDQPWRSEKPLILAECKNWSSKCGKNELVIFREKLRNRFNRCSCGFLISWKGFAETVTKEAIRGSREDFLVIPVSGEDLRKAALTNDMPGVLQGLWKEYVLA